MNIAIIYFSATGNTAYTAERIAAELQDRKHTIQMININNTKEIIHYDSHPEFLNTIVKQHDLLFVGAPVYSTHFQYYMLDLIHELPAPDDIWGQYAVPFVTYGGISSGNALYEAGKALEETGRAVPMGVKINASHTLAGTFMDYVFNENKMSEKSFDETLDYLADHIDKLENAMDYISAVGSFKYNFEMFPPGSVPDEKLLHMIKFPNIIIDKDKCTSCGKCSKNCPVFHFSLEDNIIVETDSQCIHCYKCIAGCPQKAIHIGPAEEKLAAGMKQRIESVGNTEQPESCVITGC